MNRKDLEELMPDYIFGRLEGSEKEKYELHLKKYPDIDQEIEEAKKLFQKIDKMDFDKILDSKTRNLSYKVSKRMNKSPQVSGSAYLLKFGLPAAAAIAILIFVFGNLQVKEVANKNTNFSKNLEKKVDEVINISESFSDYSYIENIPIDENEFNSSDELFNENDKLEIIKSYNAGLLFEDGTEHLLYDELENLTENEFQILLKEIENVDI